MSIQWTVISNPHAKYGGGYEEQQQVVTVLQKEVLRLTTENEKLTKNLKQDKEQEALAASVPHLKETIKDLKKENAALKKENEKLTDQLETLRNRMKKNSETSDKPSSTNIFKKPMGTRVKSGRKPGGQPGYKGHRLYPFQDPQVIDCPPSQECEYEGLVCIKGVYNKKTVDLYPSGC